MRAAVEARVPEGERESDGEGRSGGRTAGPARTRVLDLHAPGGGDPEDSQHMVGDMQTKLEQYPHSPGHRLILNNVLFPAAEKKKQRT